MFSYKFKIISYFLSFHRPAVPNRNRNFPGKKPIPGKSTIPTRHSASSNGLNKKPNNATSSARSISNAYGNAGRTSTSNRKSAASSTNSTGSTKDDNGSNKDNDEVRDDESPDQEEKEEKKFQPNNHIEAELVDILGKLQHVMLLKLQC